MESVVLVSTAPIVEPPHSVHGILECSSPLPFAIVLTPERINCISLKFH